ncbi:hypothetical protein [Sediminivirga luteola]|uniref:hypothetical protein n=1 Tax=Sediminivirga luteola TaxID=1774748 RepID=UPI001F5753CE|nr:hypothetical protein [Sediminivirga luteola]MCI2264717.1 hypothetical protein [Sediminivirga luteola]
MSQPPGPHPRTPSGPGGPYAPAGYGSAQHRPSVRPSQTGKAGKGPLIMGVAGGILLAGGIVLMVIAILSFVRIVPLGVLQQDGSPGGDALAHTFVPGQMTAELQEGQTYFIYLARSAADPRVRFDERPVVTGPSGDPYESGPATVSSNSALRGTEATVEASFVARESGLHAIDVPQPEPAQVEVTAILTLGESRGGFLSGLFGTVGSVFAAIVTGALGLTLLVAGVVWGFARRR